MRPGFNPGFLFLAGLLGLLAAATGACRGATDMQTEPIPTVFRVVGYATEASTPEALDYARLTHINYAFMLPNADGSVVEPVNLWKLDRIVALAADHQVGVLISVGGWGWDDQFETLAADPAARARFVAAVAGFAVDHRLAGVDIDWEYPDAGESGQNFLALMTELRAALPDGMLLTAAVVSHGDANGAGIVSESFALMDFVNLMAYDGDDHSTMAQAGNSLDYWLGRGLAPEKTVLGVPFYARPNGTPYAKIVQSDPAAAVLDVFEYLGAEQHYNGIPTIQAKTRLALARASGIMIWNLDQDAAGDLSLLKAVQAALMAAEGTTKP